MPFDQILPAVAEGKVDVGLIIHEGQLFYQDKGLHQIVDLGQWWMGETGLPLPLGGNVVRKDLGEATVNEIARLLRGSIEYALDHRQEALDYALNYARDLDPKLADRFVGMYVNQWTVDDGPRGREGRPDLAEQGLRGWPDPGASWMSNSSDDGSFVPRGKGKPMRFLRPKRWRPRASLPAILALIGAASIAACPLSALARVRRRGVSARRLALWGGTVPAHFSSRLPPPTRLRPILGDVPIFAARRDPRGGWSATTRPPRREG